MNTSTSEVVRPVYLGEFGCANVLPTEMDISALPLGEVVRPTQVHEFICDASATLPVPVPCLRSFVIQRNASPPVTVLGHCLRIENAGGWLAVVVHDRPNEDSIVALFPAKSVDAIYDAAASERTKPAA